MCTLMEKDVLIEEVSATAAFIGYRYRIDEPAPKEFLRTEEITDFIYASSPEKIDADQIRKELEDLKRPFLNKPIVLFDD